MARKYEIAPNQFAWNFEACEEIILIAGYEEIRSLIPPNQFWPSEFENHFFEHGNGVAFRFIDEINAIRRRQMLPKLEFKETDVFDYGRSPNKLKKSEHRQQIRNDLNIRTADSRKHMIEHALAEYARLPPPHIPFEEWKARRNRLVLESGLSRDEVAKRIRARETADIHVPAGNAAPTRPSLGVDRAARMLGLATDPELRSQIIDKLSVEEALDVAELIDDPDLRNALIRRSLAA